jgi:malate dehydrogenase
MTSMPIRSDGQKWSVVPGVPVNAFSRAKIDASVQELQEEIALVDELLPK